MEMGIPMSAGACEGVGDGEDEGDVTMLSVPLSDVADDEEGSTD